MFKVLHCSKVLCTSRYSCIQECASPVLKESSATWPCVWNTWWNNLHFYTRQSHMENYHMYYHLTNTITYYKLTNRTTSNWPSCAFLTFSSTCAHCSMRASLGAARKKVCLKVPRLRKCWRRLYSRPISRLMHSQRSMILRGVFDDSATFLEFVAL